MGMVTIALAFPKVLHEFYTYLLSTCVLGIVLGPGDNAVNETDPRKDRQKAKQVNYM